MSELHELFPCPFCGGGDLRLSTASAGDWYCVSVICETCESDGPNFEGEPANPIELDQKAVTAWNRRPKQWT